MTMPLKYTIYEKIAEAKSLTDVELGKALVKAEIPVTPDRLNKLLLDLEILGCIKVSWLTKDTRRIEVIIREQDKDPVDEQNKEATERDYEASFPGADT